VRLVALLLWVVVAAVLMTSLLRRLAAPVRRARASLPDELVKDPVCRTYIVKSRAVSRTTGGQARYFCSDECARRA
jgi:hypothetical protein